MASIYALLVGINDYSKAGASNLAGCVDDISFYRDFLTDRYRDSLRLELLFDSDATRANIIDQFRSHLAKATKDDVVLFAYAGHGARWKSAPEFAKFFPDGYDEGLVCYDSRSESGAFDLADKELGALLQDIAVNEPHIAIILDSCHSGSATRSAEPPKGARARATLAVEQPRPFDSYLGGYYAKRGAAQTDLVLPESKHILLAACSRTQQALELDGRGSFSSKMEKVLTGSGGEISYSELFSRCRAAMRVPRGQDPQFETYGHFNANTMFLGSSVSAESRPLVYFHSTENKWLVECGALQSLPTHPDAKVEFSVQDDDGKELGVARVLRVRPKVSEIEMPKALENEISDQYKGELLSLPVPPLPVFLGGDEAVTALMRAALQPADGIEFVKSIDGVDYSVEARGDSIQLARASGELIREEKGAEAPAMMRGWLKHLVRFNRTLALQNSSTAVDFSSIDTHVVVGKPGSERRYAISLQNGRDLVAQLGDSGSPSDDNLIVVTYAGDGKNQADDIPISFECSNRTGTELQVLVLSFSREFAVKKRDKMPVPPGGATVPLKGTALFLDAGLEEETIVYKFLVSTDEIDDQFLEMDALGVVTRGERGDDANKYEHEWYTTTVEVKLVRPN